MSGDSQREFYEARIARLSAEMPGFRPDIVRAIIALSWAHDAVARQMNGFLARYELSTATLNVLIILSERDRLPLSELSQLLVKTAANVTGLIDGLVKRGLVERQPHSQDRRVKLVSLTPTGRELLESLFPSYHARVCQVFGTLTPLQLETITSLVLRLAENAERDFTDEGP